MELEDAIDFEYLKACRRRLVEAVYTGEATKETNKALSKLNKAVNLYRHHWCSRCGYTTFEHDHDFI